ncbi:formylglycine-generating enzyme family protein [Myxococcota bacterium]|nr:formylglycine-generating enzyme family protein [Myxococcota bacterium]
MLNHDLRISFLTSTVMFILFVPACGGEDSSDDMPICDAGYHPVGNSCVEDVAPAGFVEITAGTFTMGSPMAEPGREPDEIEHLVTLTNNFYLADHEVTQGEFESLMTWNPSHFGPNGDGAECGAECPVEMVSWFDTLAYINQLSINEGLTPCYIFSAVVCVDSTSVDSTYMSCMSTMQGGIESATVGLNGVSSVYACEGYRLPTEAEWEYAARAGSTTAFSNGDITYTDCTLDANLNEIGWYCGNSDATTHPVASKAANAWGLYDMSGNVSERVWDWFEEYDGDVSDPEGPLSGSDRGLRGGVWGYGSLYCRSAARHASEPSSRRFGGGFRVCISAR